MLKVSVKNNIIKLNLFDKVTSALIAVSGGIDSTVLAHILVGINKSFNFNIKYFIAHLNHSFRGEESDRDEEFVKDLASKLGLEAFTKKIDVPAIIKSTKESSSQNIARNIRIKFLMEVASHFKTDTIILAHNLDDLVETFFMRLFKGSGATGLSSISPLSQSEGFRFIRPLLNSTRDEIEKYSKENKIEFVHDSSNDTDKYDRNKIRHQLIPLIKKEFNPNIEKTIEGITTLIRGDEKYLSGIVLEVYENLIIEENENLIEIDLEKFNNLPESIKTRIIRKMIQSLNGDLKAISYTNIKDILFIALADEKRKKLNLTKSLFVEKINFRLKIQRISL